MFDGLVAGWKLHHPHLALGFDRLAGEMLLATLFLKVSVTFVTYFVLSAGGF